MAERYLASDEIDARTRTHETLQRLFRSNGREPDPLAELARLIGENDPFSNGEASFEAFAHETQEWRMRPSYAGELGLLAVDEALREFETLAAIGRIRPGPSRWRA